MNKPRKAKSRRLDPLPLDATETKCGICLDDVVKRAKIGPCSHLYCFTCLLAWSRLNNTCPQCKLTFRCISRVDFLTNKLEEKVFIKDKTIKRPESSDDDYPFIDSEEIEDSDPDFIDNTDVPNTYSDEEPEAMFTQKRRCIRSARGRIGRAFTDSESEDESARCHQSIMDKLDQSPDLFCAKGEATPPRKTLSRINCPFNSARETEKITQTSRTDRSPLTSRTYGTERSPIISRHSPRPSSSSVYFTSPKYNKGSRWAQLDKNVRRIKRKRGNKTAAKKPAIAISTVTSSGNSTGKWLSTRHTSPYFNKNKENQTPTKSVNAAFKLPFKKTVLQKTSPGKLFEDPEDYFARIIAEDDSI